MRHEKTTLHAFAGADRFVMAGGSFFIYVHTGELLLNGVHMMAAGMYASVAHGKLITFSETQALVIHHRDPQAMFMLGGPIELRGRLRYIDGCSDSLLIPPIRQGDPCLNHLHFPPGVTQTMHTHPSLRVGLVTRGHGECVTPFGNVPLLPGHFFLIFPENGTDAVGLDGRMHKVGAHSFRTGQSSMDIVAVHPDSVFGPTDDSHQMLNATIIDGATASDLRKAGAIA